VVVRSGASYSPRAVLWRLVHGDLEPGQPIAITRPASSEAIDAVLGTKRGSPRVVPDEAKFAITDCASRGSSKSKTFGAVEHCSLLLVLSSLFVDHPFSRSHFMSSCAFQRIQPKTWRSAAQLNVGKSSGIQRGQGTIRRFKELERRSSSYRDRSINWRRCCTAATLARPSYCLKRLPKLAIG
jgi:hypothetical protein